MRVFQHPSWMWKQRSLSESPDCRHNVTGRCSSATVPSLPWWTVPPKTMDPKKLGFNFLLVGVLSQLWEKLLIWVIFEVIVSSPWRPKMLERVRMSFCCFLQICPYWSTPRNQESPDGAMVKATSDHLGGGRYHRESHFAHYFHVLEILSQELYGYNSSSCIKFIFL